MKIKLFLLVFCFSLMNCNSSKKKASMKLDPKTKKYWKWNSSTGGDWN